MFTDQSRVSKLANKLFMFTCRIGVPMSLLEMTLNRQLLQLGIMVRNISVSKFMCRSTVQSSCPWGCCGFGRDQ